MLHEDCSAGGEGAFGKRRQAGLRGHFLTGCGQGGVEVTGLTQRACCPPAPVRRGLWLAVGAGIRETFQDRISRKNEKLLVGHQEQRRGSGQRGYSEDKLCGQRMRFQMLAGPLGSRRGWRQGCGESGSEEEQEVPQG